MHISNNPKRALILVMGALVLLGFGIAKLYYDYDNGKVDPRVIKARELYSRYDDLAQANNFNAVFILLDSMEEIYQGIDSYRNSFEVGVLYNNRVAAYLSMAIYFDDNSLSLDGIRTLSKDTLLLLSETNVQISIAIYENWLSEFENKDEATLTKEIFNSFLKGLESYSDKMKNRFVSKRVQEMLIAQSETKRRLSVAYTNQGIIFRHREKYEEAITCYQKATELWDRNLTAENNLNTLLGKPIRKQNMLQKIFPPEKEK